ncbi:MAG: ABC transporter permease subunit [Mycoplasmoidaceae bacterium]
MFKYVLKRILYTLITLIVLLTILFFLMQLIPGFPIEKALNETDAAFEARLRALGLLDNPLVQYFNFWGRLFTKGEFGIIFRNSGNVVNEFIEPVKYTLLIALPAFVISSFLGVIFGTIAAYNRGKWQDTVINVFSVLFMSIPSFVLALYLIQFAGLLGLPTNVVVPGSSDFTVGKMLLSLIIPITSMVMTSVSATVYFTRNELVEIFKQEYIKTALSKGMSFKVVVFKHAFRNASIPILYSLLPSLLLIISGSIIIEKFFNVPGTAVLVINAVQTNEYYIVLFSALFYSGIYFLLQIVFDALSTVIDPRIKLAEKSGTSYIEQMKSYFARKKDISYNPPVQILAEKKLLRGAVIPKKEDKYNLNFARPEVSCDGIQEFDKKLFKRIDSNSLNNNEILGKPQSQLTDIYKRFVTNKFAVFCSIILILIILISIFVPIFGPSINAPLTSELKDIISFLPPRIPWLGIDGTTTQIMSQERFDAWNIALNGDLIWNEMGDGLFEVTFNPYKLPMLSNYYPFFGTGPQGRDWMNMLWISTSNSLYIALLVSLVSTIIGSIYGAIAGFNAGKPIDTFMMRLVELISGVPTIVWILVITLAFSGGGLSMATIAGALIFTSWIWPATTARIFVLKYKDADFINASKTLGANRTRLIFTHLLPNISGKLMVRFVNQIPKIIFFETSLVFLGLKAPTDASLGTMIETARQTGYVHLLLAPTLIIVIITLCAQIIANAFNDSLDPRVIGK